jgi:predicted nucleotidyltransferase
MLITAGVARPVKTSQEQYVQLTYDAFRDLRENVPLDSFAVYGSVARGEAKPISDLDILVISAEFEGSIASRMDALSFVDRTTKAEIDFLKSRNYNTFLSFYPLRPKEVERLPILFLDLVEDALIVYDRDGFLEGTLSKLKAKLELRGSRRVVVGGKRYWDLAPNYRPGEVIEI